jgi:tRNA pseudouridine38-40 synthase
VRFKIEVEYDGARFNGWQKQAHAHSVQGTLEDAIEKVFDCSEKVEVYGAGRTDAGVHALRQTAHFDVSSPNIIDRWKDCCDKLTRAVNFYAFGSGTIVLKTEVAPIGFHARFSAKMRRYKYIIYNRPIDSVIFNGMAWHVRQALDVDLMNEAAGCLIGTHNFNSFRSAHCSAKNPVRTISDISVSREGNFVTIDVASRSFLHNQVRIISGTLKQVGTHKLTVDDVKNLLKEGDRTKAGETAPPHGLYLVEITY